MSSIREIWKYELTMHVRQHPIPEDAVFLDLQMQNGVPVMWWSVNPNSPTRLRTFEIATTGPPGFAPHLHYVGTFQDGGFVGHVLSHEPIPVAARSGGA